MKEIFTLKDLDTLKNIDVFICAAGFENRSYIIPTALATIEIPNSIIFYINDFYIENINNADKIYSILNSNFKQRVELKYNNPSFSYKAIKEVIENNLNGINISGKILIDITTFSHEHLLMFIKIISEYQNLTDKIVFCYLESKEYSIDEKDYDKKWLTKGIKEVRTIIGYPGNFDPSKENHLLIIMGFENERTKKIIEIFDYEHITLINGAIEESINNEHYAINKSKCNNLIELFPNINNIEVSVIDIIKCKKHIEAYLDIYNNCNNVIIPMNNKISTIACGLLGISNKDIQLSYISAEVYNKFNYSMHGENVHMFKNIF
ncbi:hypothetical protein [Ruminiclostridium cellobioparum]|uniref:Uncharacterized protein n=1 Tax=Ruminiclostridium cellobioparum subsp. termitidis CT1112 TaxID=1195236 RepID=S0FJP9_RUMCE|nr:hypothetical protein [Ruminiclostridium cellobioparum]EMS70531.1 hypothetical protein CTER_3728 [Ruminiclostridium cellobioparum subsp. termitidis CT1112]